MKQSKVNRLVMAALFLNLGLVLPFFTGNIPYFGAALLPMHIPVLLAGIVVGPKYGALIGLMLPIIRYYMIGMPPLFPIGAAMTFELAAYGGIIGLLYIKLPKTPPHLYASLIGAMLAGRAVWGLAMVVISGLSDVAFSFQIFLTAAFVTAVPGIVFQIVFIPTLIMVLKKAGVFDGQSASAR